MEALGRGRAGPEERSRSSRAGRRSRARRPLHARPRPPPRRSTTTPSPATPTPATWPACSVPPSISPPRRRRRPRSRSRSWLESLQMLRSLEPKRICMTHFGVDEDDAEGQIARVEAWLKDAAEESSHGDPRAVRGVARMRGSTPRATRSPSACARRCRPTSCGRASSATGESAARRRRSRKAVERPRARPCQTASFAAGACLHL